MRAVHAHYHRIAHKITRDILVEHYKKYFVPSGELAGVVGDITPKDAVAKLEKALGAWKGGPG
jgi:predicted Zn-dependent peptidase